MADTLAVMDCALREHYLPALTQPSSYFMRWSLEMAQGSVRKYRYRIGRAKSRFQRAALVRWKRGAEVRVVRLERELAEQLAFEKKHHVTSALDEPSPIFRWMS